MGVPNIVIGSSWVGLLFLGVMRVVSHRRGRDSTERRSAVLVRSPSPHGDEYIASSDLPREGCPSERRGG